ncbi:hypothetical protein EXM22_11260 [Oceanispirochaeta crateris]|uniref:GerMN domain-containing protein n=1 Tax=Oceanispirochaeta crateris TaxID=2518645 RepID=A0A5C1QK76_9SPIO|nr:GerMN domain-containing protein [Oceanispirochaeta crateris]QEN08535.1 hypothetical protein EXM22_11260 [Oceanispirochaeta crateris]
MSKNQKPVNKYKKMNPSSTSATNRRGTKQTFQTGKNTLKNHPQKSQSDKVQMSQIVVLILLSVICLILLGLVFYFFQPGKSQLWQIPNNNSGSATIKRLEPAEAESETALPPITEVPKESAEEKKAPSETETIPTREARIYFVKVNTEGQISLKSVSRNIDFSSFPLTQTINSLIDGPASDELNKGSLTLIPEGTRLLSARVESGTAYLNFNEAFRFNPLGREGYLAQLKQIVYTSTEFPSIKNVQILIEGVIKEYLGGEGFYIGKPLSRDSFQNNS